MPTILFNDELDRELERHMPPELRGRKCAQRVHAVVREWLEERAGRRSEPIQPSEDSNGTPSNSIDVIA